MGLQTSTEEEAPCKNLPLDQDAVNLYGDYPVIHRLKNCHAYQDSLSVESNNGVAVKPILHAGGLYYNTGTNAFVHALNNYVGLLGNHSFWETPWGISRHFSAHLVLHTIEILFG
jgi:hypothetical protein